MTITLQDVSCLWDLPIKGTPITGYSNIGAWDLIGNLLGTGESLRPFKITNRRNNNRSRYNISLKWLRENFLELPEGSSDEVIDRYCRAYILDLFGSIVFPNDTDDSVPACYLQFLTDLRTPQNYNWGGAALGMLYYELSQACRWDNHNIAGPLLLLQHWSWTRFQVGCPSHRGTPPPAFGGDDIDARCPFGTKWCGPHTFKLNPARTHIDVYRDGFEDLEDHHVVWSPYSEWQNLSPRCVTVDNHYWLVRAPLICLWMVSYHYPDRVMRQFGLYQPIPPRSPHTWAENNKLDRIKHSSNNHGNWAKYHQRYCDEWGEGATSFIIAEGPFVRAEWSKYRSWFWKFGMPSIHFKHQIEAELVMPRHSISGPVENLGYQAHAPRNRRMALRAAHEVRMGMNGMLKSGMKKISALFVKSSRATLIDLNEEPEYEHIREATGFPEDIDSMCIDEEEPAAPSLDPYSARYWTAFQPAPEEPEEELDASYWTNANPEDFIYVEPMFPSPQSPQPSMPNDLQSVYTNYSKLPHQYEFFGSSTPHEPTGEGTPTQSTTHFVEEFFRSPIEITPPLALRREERERHSPDRFTHSKYN